MTKFAKHRASVFRVLLVLLCHSAILSCSWSWSAGHRRQFSIAFTPTSKSVPPSTSKELFAAATASDSDDSLSTRDDGAGPACPFSMTFRRYRVNLSSGPDSGKRANRANRPPSLLGGLTKAWARQQLEQQGYQWMKGYSDLDAFCYLWTTAAKMSASSDPASASSLLAFPDAAPRVVRQWLDLLEWIQNHEDRESLAGTSRRLQAEYSLESDVPCIKLASTPNCSPNLPKNEALVSWDPAVIEQRTKSWVQRVLVDLSICPFTKSTRLSGQGLADVGVPVARIDYRTSAASTMIPLLADGWHAVANMIAMGPKGKEGISSILLAAPSYDDDFRLWAGPVFAVLEASVVAAGMESQVGVVCFHPHYATPDGSTFPGFGHMHSVPRLERWVRESRPELAGRCSTADVAAGGAWQRRTPHATINVLRADQLQAAESKRNTPQMYARNIETLLEIGNERLQTDLEKDRALCIEHN